MKRISLISIIALTLTLQGCGFVAGAAIGGTAGYLLKDEGYDVRSPVTKDSNGEYGLQAPLHKSQAKYAAN